MINHLDTDELCAIASRGAGLTVSAAQFSGEDLKRIASRLLGNAILHVVDSNALDSDAMKALASRAPAPAYVMFS